ncbi:MAG: hypothetical protein R2856_04765 [Caldilineaceae bacterium]
MSRSETLLQWTACVSSNLPQLSVSQARVLAWWSFGIAMTGSCGRLTVATFLGLLCGQKVNTVEQRLYEWCLDAKDKGGKHRRELVLPTCQVALLEWIVRLWVGTQLALALDATSLGDRFVVLAVSVVYRGCGIPVAWVVLPAGQKGAWRKEWLRMLRLLRPAVPPEWTVIVLADRGLYAGWLYRRIVRLHWHPFLRINNGAKFRPAGCARWYGLKELVGTVGHQWQGRGSCFKDPVRRLECTLLAWWAPANEDPWFILTDLAPTDSAVTWYGLRTWCEQGFKCNKRGGWQWQLTQMHQPERAARLWLAMSVATLWMVSVGSDLECGANLDDPDIPDLHNLLDIKPKRHIRLLRLGRLWLLVKAIACQAFHFPQQLLPEPWPSPLSHSQAAFANLSELST